MKDLISGQSISFELRSLSDSPDRLIPEHMFLPSKDLLFVSL
ncbi:hypothetical protein [Methylobacterium sp. UNC300MFChir4.1]|nr:hypothetical protein [Methylobacterium sp. UNC300MFChir4.1]